MARVAELRTAAGGPGRDRGVWADVRIQPASTARLDGDPGHSRSAVRLGWWHTRSATGQPTHSACARDPVHGARPYYFADLAEGCGAGPPRRPGPMVA